ncbi:MAG TPA: PspA/IM30 family protein, partial [Candidatus Nitrosopolaris sp.]|nr:PspA/IM30 family protein [Candidatus Nitrosopolaris sp.]
AKAQALDEMIDSGVLTDYTSTSGSDNDIERELQKMTVKSSINDELAKLKAERLRKKRHGQTEEEQQAQK